MVIHIAYAADANYGSHAGVSMASVIASNPAAALHFHLLADGITARDLARIRRMTEAASSRLSVYDVTTKFDGRKNYARGASKQLTRTAKHLTRTAYARLFLDTLVPPAIEYMLYLDCDTLCLGDLGDLWKLRAETNFVRAVASDYFEGDRRAYKSDIGLPLDAPYYSSGVMLINLAAWRQRALGKNFAAFAETHPSLRFLDQDVINGVLGREIQPLDPVWNTCDPATARILHFAGKYKPWQWRFDESGADLYQAVKRASPWRYCLPEFGLIRTLHRLKTSAAKKLRAAT